MYGPTSHQILRQHRAEFVPAAATVRLSRTTGGTGLRPLWNPKGDISRYVGLIAGRP
jgi:hypothetical protein